MREYKGEFTVKGVVFAEGVTKEEAKRNAELSLFYAYLTPYTMDVLLSVLAEINLVKVELEC